MKKANNGRPTPAALVKEVRSLLGEKLLEKVNKYTLFLVDYDGKLSSNRMFLLSPLICIRRANDHQNMIVDLDVVISRDFNDRKAMIISPCPAIYFETSHTAKEIVESILKHKFYV